jgi:hypothetical protein
MTRRKIATYTSASLPYITSYTVDGHAELVTRDKFGVETRILLELANWVKFCRDNLTRAREAGEEAPDEGVTPTSPQA